MYCILYGLELTANPRLHFSVLLRMRIFGQDLRNVADKKCKAPHITVQNHTPDDVMQQRDWSVPTSDAHLHL